ncbi:MAG: S41 family peptidase [Rhabdochlamydiaceae bacterium]|nr:S41 family peptidase [Candidatus Amphrikana amoebophyrae]
MKKLTRLFLIAFIILLQLVVEAKPPELTPKIAKAKIDEFLTAHIVHKTLSDEVIKRSLQNYIQELDPGKGYFLDHEIAHWKEPDSNLIANVRLGIEKHDFTHFKEMYEQMLVAIERRDKIEEQLKKMEFPKDVKLSEFTEMTWAKSEEELLTRLLRIRGLQTEAAEKIEEGTKELLLKRLEKIRLSKQSEFVEADKADKERLLLSYCLKSVASALDTHTAYFTPQEANQFMIHVQQRLYGIGAGLRDDLNGLTVVSLVEGGPAEQSKLLKMGDRVIGVNGEPIIGLEISEAVELIRGPEGTEVKLTLMREVEGDEEKISKKIDIDITRKEVVLSESRYNTHLEPFGNGVIASIHLHSFYQDSKTSSALDLRKEIAKIKSEHNLLGVVLDLRFNAGGLLTQAVEVSGLFINRGIVASIKDYMGNIQHLRNFENNPAWTGPLLVLTNRASASAAEIVAQSMQDYGRALIIGDDFSYGKGTYQTFTLEANHSGNINPEGEFKVTRGMYFTVSGKSPQNTGLKSDIEVPGPLSAADIGERFSKNAILNDSIKSNFKDDLADIHPLHRFRMRAIYSKELEEKTDKWQAHIPSLQANSSKRMKLNNNYKAFLEDLVKMKDDDYPRENRKKYGQNDLQHEESLNVMKDLIILEATNKIAM